MSEIDWRKILIAYADHVGANESCSFLPSTEELEKPYVYQGGPLKLVLTKAEIAALYRAVAEGAWIDEHKAELLCHAELLEDISQNEALLKDPVVSFMWQLPETAPEDHVIISTASGLVGEAVKGSENGRTVWYWSNGPRADEDDEVIGWMPLPPPKAT